MNQVLEDTTKGQYAAFASRQNAVDGVRVSGGVPLQQTSVVRDVEVLHRGSVFKASYFVEHGVIHAKIGNGIRQIPLNDCDAAATVVSHLTGYLHQADRKRELARLWSGGFGTESR